MGEEQNPVGFGTTGMNETERMEADGEEKPQQVAEPTRQTAASQRTRKGEKRKAKPPVGSVAQLIRTNYEIKTGVRKLQRADVRAVLTAPGLEEAGLVILLDTFARFSWDRGRPARLNTCGPSARCGRDARDPRGALSLSG